MNAERHSNLTMSSLVNVTIHSSQFPDNVRRDLLESLRLRQVNHKFHYDSVKQTQKWLALHQAYSPSRTDPDCGATYDRSFQTAAGRIRSQCVHLIGLGCGGGQKDTHLLQLLQRSGKKAFYTPSDVSTAMVLVAQQMAQTAIPEDHCHSLVCDLATAADLPIILEQLSPDSPASRFTHHATRNTQHATRLLTFFGMLPNFEPALILPRLSALVRPGDYLLLSANLAPGPDYAAGVQRILPQYDNDLTRDWLMTFLLDLGVEKRDGELRFVIEDDPTSSDLKRIAAYFRFLHSREIQVEDQHFEFHPGESIRIFFSYRHTPALVRALLGQHGLQILDQWLTRSEEEGVFLLSRA